MKNYQILLTLLLAHGLCFLLPAQNSLLWEVQSSSGKVSYLFGTYHLVGSAYLDEHPSVQEAYNTSQTVIVETQIDSSKLSEVAMMSIMEGQSLSDFYDLAQFKMLSEEFQQKTGMSLSAMQQLKPIAIAMFYTLTIAQQQLASTELNYPGVPIDLFFASNGKKRGKEVVSLETMMEQMDILYNSDPLEEQAELLLQLIEDDSVQQISIDLLEHYARQDLQAMYKLSQEQEDSYGDMSILLDDRNNRWLEKLRVNLDKGAAFIAVGALHLPGEEGLIELLRKEGYTVKAILQ